MPGRWITYPELRGPQCGRPALHGAAALWRTGVLGATERLAASRGGPGDCDRPAARIPFRHRPATCVGLLRTDRFKRFARSWWPLGGYSATTGIRTRRVPGPAKVQDLGNQVQL